MKNLFGTAYDKLSSIYTGVQSYFRTQQKPVENKLLKQIQACCYSKQNIGKIHQAVEKVLKEYPELESGLLTFSEDLSEKSLIQLQGNLSVQYKSKAYPVKAKVYIPQEYPRQAPMIRIVNTEPENYKISSVYQEGRSSTNPNSYVLVQLQAFKNWNPQYLDICSMILEAKQMLGKNFPWKRIASSGAKSREGKKQEQKVMQINQVNIEQLILKPVVVPSALLNYQSHCKQALKQLASTVPYQHSSPIQDIQSLTIINEILNVQIPAIKNYITKVQTLIQENQQLHSRISLSEIVYVEGKDSFLLDQICQNKTLGEQLELLERLFSKKQINFETLLKHFRRIEEQRFIVRHAIKYMMSAQLS